MNQVKRLGWVGVWILFFFALYNYLHNVNELTRLRMEVPELEERHRSTLARYRTIEDRRLRQVQIKQLYAYTQEPRFAHLRHYVSIQPLPLEEAKKQPSSSCALSNH